MTHIKVGINGYGVIGKRVADAVALQPDMELVGVADVATDYRVRMALARGYRLFGSTADATTAMRRVGLEPAGELDELLAEADVVVDATPKRVGAANKAAYEAAGVKAIFQGGEKHEHASFTAGRDSLTEPRTGRTRMQEKTMEAMEAMAAVDLTRIAYAAPASRRLEAVV